MVVDLRIESTDGNGSRDRKDGWYWISVSKAWMGSEEKVRMIVGSNVISIYGV